MLDLHTPGPDSRFGLVRLAGRSMPPFYTHLRAFIAGRFGAADPSR